MSKFLLSRRWSEEQSEDGGIFIFGLYIFATIAVISGLAIDMSQLIAERSRLQTTTDLAAHAALYNRDTESSSDSIAAALAVVETTMPAARYGSVIGQEDILFGNYDYASGEFEVNPNSRNAVLVSAGRYAENQNAVQSFLMQFVGYEEFDISVQSLFVTYRPACLREGFVAERMVDLRSNNGFSNGFCIHSNEHVSLNSNNVFEEGTVVSMPDLDDLDIPNSGFETNTGLELALREGRQHIRILNMIDEIADGILTFGSEHMPDYITNPDIVTHTGRFFNSEDFVPGTINYIDCRSGMTLKADTGTFNNVVIYSTCHVKFNEGVILEDAVLFSESTRNDSFKAAAGVQIGRNDQCATGGGAQLITLGGIRFPADLKMYGGQLIALGNIQFAANANGIEGASMVSAEYISGTSNMEMAFCGTGMEGNFEAEYFRLAR